MLPSYMSGTFDLGPLAVAAVVIAVTIAALVIWRERRAK